MNPKSKLTIEKGHKFHYLTVIKEDEPKVVFRKKRNCTEKVRYFQCVCRCGNITSVTLGHLTIGHSRSCGCLSKENKGNYKHGLSKDILWATWHGIVDRCCNVNSKKYIGYGLRGVKICDEWKNNYLKFKEWALLNGWEKGLQVDKDIKGTGFLYSPETCLIVTPLENGQKRRNTVYVQHNGEQKKLKQLSVEWGISLKTLLDRYYRGWSVEEMSTPVRIHKDGRYY